MQKNDDAARPEPEVGEDGRVPIYHPSDLEARVLPKAVRGWERQGWFTDKEAATKAKADADAAQAKAEAPATVKPETATSPATPAKSEAAPAVKSK